MKPPVHVTKKLGKKGGHVKFPDKAAELREKFRAAPWAAFIDPYRRKALQLEDWVLYWLQQDLKIPPDTEDEVIAQIKGDLYRGGTRRPHSRYVRTCTREHGVVRFLTPFQDQVVQALSDPAVREIYGIGPNRGGKSMAGGLVAAWFCHGVWPIEGVEMPDPPVQVWCGVPDLKNHAGPITVPILRWALGKQGVEYRRKDTMFLVCSHLRDRQVACQKCKDPSEVYLKSYKDTIDSHQGGAPVFIWDDEIPPEHIFGEHRSRIGGAHPLRILVTLTPLRQASWINNEIREPWLADGKPKRILFTDELSLEDNPYLSQDDVDQVYEAHKHNPEELEVRTKGRWAAVSGKVFGMLKRDVHVVDDFEIPGVHRAAKEDEQMWTLYRAHDPGLRNFAVMLWVAVSPDGLCWIYRESFLKDRSIPELCKVYWEMQTPLENTARWPGRKSAFWYSVVDPAATQRDSADNTRRIDRYLAPYREGESAEWRALNDRYGIIFTKGNNERQGGIDAMMSAFSYELDNEGRYRRPPKYRFFASCEQSWREHTRYSWMPANPFGVRGPRDDAVKKEDHSVDSCRYLEATAGGPVFIEPSSVDMPEYQPISKKTGY